MRLHFVEALLHCPEAVLQEKRLGKRSKLRVRTLNKPTNVDQELRLPRKLPLV